MKSAGKSASTTVNGIDVDALMEVVEAVRNDPSKGMVGFHVTSAWKGQTRSEATVESYTLGGERITRRHTMPVDEPVELLGTDTAPNPQEMLMAALNACVMVGYVAGAALRGITLETLEVETTGELDLRGFLGIDERVKPGYDTVRYTVRIKGNGTPEQFQEIHETVMKTSPNYFNISQPVTIEARMEVL
jgi:uncharacterized OsmC-like protein